MPKHYFGTPGGVGPRSVEEPAGRPTTINSKELQEYTEALAPAERQFNESRSRMKDMTTSIMELPPEQRAKWLALLKLEQKMAGQYQAALDVVTALQAALDARSRGQQARVTQEMSAQILRFPVIVVDFEQSVRQFVTDLNDFFGQMTTAAAKEKYSLDSFTELQQGIVAEFLGAWHGIAKAEEVLDEFFQRVRTPQKHPWTAELVNRMQRLHQHLAKGGEGKILLEGLKELGDDINSTIEAHAGLQEPLSSGTMDALNEYAKDLNKLATLARDARDLLAEAARQERHPSEWTAKEARISEAYRDYLQSVQRFDQQLAGPKEVEQKRGEFVQKVGPEPSGTSPVVPAVEPAIPLSPEEEARRRLEGPEALQHHQESPG